LPGIAGIVLTIGMSVDANVLIFEWNCSHFDR
jgi:preprotein translocase subunit SecD